jgi:hypothetical protein
LDTVGGWFLLLCMGLNWVIAKKNPSRWNWLATIFVDLSFVNQSGIAVSVMRLPSNHVCGTKPYALG